MIDHEMQFAAQHNYASRTIDIYLYSEDRRNKQVITAVEPLTFNKLEDGKDIAPILRLPLEVASRLMDQLWQTGIRPTEVGTTGQLEAVQVHLSDMRKIAFQFLDNLNPQP